MPVLPAALNRSLEIVDEASAPAVDACLATSAFGGDGFDFAVWAKQVNKCAVQ